MNAVTDGRRWRLPVISLIVFCAAWQGIGMLEISPALPRLDRVLAALVEVLRDARFVDAAVSTGATLLIAFPPTVVAGIAIGVLMGTVRVADWALTPYVNLSLSLPLVSVIPVIILIFGLERMTLIVVIVTYTLPVIIVNTMAGVRSVDPDMRAMARSFGASRGLALRRVVLPSASQLVLSGVRIATGRAIKGVIIAEQVVGLIGLGGLVQRLGGAFAVEQLYAVILFIGLVGVASVALLGRLERRVAPA